LHVTAASPIIGNVIMSLRRDAVLEIKAQISSVFTQAHSGGGGEGGELGIIRVSPYVKFTNILRAAFIRADPKSAKKTVMFNQCLFALLGSLRIKAARKTLVKSTPCLCKNIHEPSTS